MSNGDNNGWRQSVTIEPVDAIAYKDDEGRWRAGQDSGKYDSGQIVPEDYAERARAQRQRANMEKGIMHNQGVSREEAREIANQMKERFEQADSEQEIRDIRREFLGYE